MEQKGNEQLLKRYIAEAYPNGEVLTLLDEVIAESRKDERERVIRECVEVVESFILPGGKGVATVDHANNCLQSVSLALKGLDNNK